MGRGQAEEDVLVGGAHGPSLRERLRRPRPRIAVVAAFLLGLVLGGSALHVWHTRPAAPDIHLATTLTVFYRFDDQATANLTVHNLDEEPVTVYDAELNLVGLDVVGRHIWPGPPYPSIPGDGTHGIAVQLSADCSREVERVGGRAVFSASVESGPRQRVQDLDIPVTPSLRNYYNDVCPGR